MRRLLTGTERHLHIFWESDSQYTVGAQYVDGMGATSDSPIDGRRARRERNRLAVIDAVFALVRDGGVPPTADAVAERAGVSVSSVFRNFDGLDDLHREAFDVFQQRYVHLFEPAVDDTAPRTERVTRHVRTRIELLAAAGPMMLIARQRSLDHEPIADGVARSRALLLDQTRAHFAVEARQLSPAESANLLAVVDAMTSPEAHDVMQAAHGRSGRQIARSWVRSLEAIFAGWPGLRTEAVTRQEIHA